MRAHYRQRLTGASSETELYRVTLVTRMNQALLGMGYLEMVLKGVQVQT